MAYQIPETPERITFRGFAGVDVRRTSIFPENFVAQENVAKGLLLDGRNLRFTPDGRAYWYRNQLKIDGPTNLTGDVLPLALYEFYASDYNQLLCFTDDGKLNVLDTDWTHTPAQWDYGYELFAGHSWSEKSTAMPVDGLLGFAQARNRLLICSGDSTTYTDGMPTQVWDGAALEAVGLSTPTTAPTAAADTGAGDELVKGTYSWYVVYGNAKYESMPGPIVDLVLEDAAATGYVEPKTLATQPSDGDTVDIGGQTYTFVDDGSWTNPMPAGSILIDTRGVQYTYQHLATAINTGYLSTSVPLAGRSYTDVGTPNALVTAEWEYSAGVTIRVNLTARTVGTGGNTIGLTESTSDARVHVSGAVLSGGVTEHHVDLSSVPTGPSGTTYRRLYRAYTESVEAGARGTDFQYLATIADNSTTTYADNTPQSELGEPIAFDHSIPPRGDILAYHRDRLWMAGVVRAGESYQSVWSITPSTGASRATNVVTITTTTPHTLIVGDQVVIAGVTTSSFNGTFTVTSCPTSTSFTYSQTATNATSGGGTVTAGVQVSDLENVLFYSQLDEPYYWPLANQITVGSSAPIVALVSWNEQLLILKTDSAWLLTGYGESDFTLYQVPGMTGVLGPHAATSPYGVLLAGHEGLVLWDGQNARTVCEYREDHSFSHEPPDLRPPRTLDGASATAPAICYHGSRFYIQNGEYMLAWHPARDMWECYHLVTDYVGLRSVDYSAAQSHVLAWMQWGETTSGTFYITALHSQYMPYSSPNGNYGDASGDADDDFYGEVRIELPPITLDDGMKVNPLEVWVYGDWDLPMAGDPLAHVTADDLHLYIYDEAGAKWDDIGVVTQNRKLGIPSGYARQNLRLLLKGAHVAYFALHGVTVVFQRRAGRG